MSPAVTFNALCQRPAHFCLTLPCNHVSWHHLPNKLVPLESLSQGLFLGQLKLGHHRHRSGLHAGFGSWFPLGEVKHLKERNFHWPLNPHCALRGSKKKVKVSHTVHFFAIPWTVASLAPLSMEFSRQEYWSCHFLLQGIFPGSIPESPALQVNSLPAEPVGKPMALRQ